MELSLMEKFADPAMFDSLTMGEKAIGALITTCMGMGITFIVLLLLWLVMNIMSKTIAKEDKTIVKSESVNIESTTLNPEQNEALEDNEELVAVISAAISAYESSNGSVASNFVVRKITRLNGNAWGNAGVADCIESRKIY